MKILLASDSKFLFNQGFKLFGIPDKDIRIGWIITASKGAKSTSYIDKFDKEMKDRNLSFEKFDIEGKSKEEIIKFLENKNIVYVEGGNTFYLLKAIRESGFDKILKEFLTKNKIYYAGPSAGAYIMCPTIEVSTWGPNAKPRYGLENLTALGHVPFFLKVHYTDDQESLVREKIKTFPHPLRILRDGQGIYCENNVCKFFGDGEEVILK